MKKTIFSIVAVMSLLCANAAVEDDKVLLTIDGEPIKKSEFLYIYEKNNQEASDVKNVDEYLELFINFRLKVHEAEQLGLDTTASFLQELKSYRAQAMPKYMVCQSAEDSMVMLSYDHIARDRRVAHIAVKCPANASAEEEAASLERINTLRMRVTTGLPITVQQGKKTVVKQGEVEDFYAVALEASDDPSKVENQGELGWIVPFRYVWPLEKAVYETPVGEVSAVFRTNFGFHIALIEEERAHQEIHASHIMKMVPRGNDSLDVVAKQQIDSLYGLLVDGADFATLATAASDDKGSAMRGGDLGWFGYGMMVKEFETAAFALQPGEMSQPIRSPYGWHIIVLQEQRGMQPFSEMEEELRRRVKADERYKEVQYAFLQQIRAQYDLPADMLDKAVLAVEESHLEEKYPDFKNLIQEYHDGILLFDISLQNVWDKASLDTAGITEFFASHKANYKWAEPRYKGMVIYCKDKVTMKVMKGLIKTAHPDSLETYINTRVNIDSTAYVHVERGMWKKGMNGAVDKLQFKSGDWKATEEYPYVFLSGKLLKNPETYLDERGKVTSDYQDYLEKLWVEELRQKYAVVVDQDVLKEIRETIKP